MRDLFELWKKYESVRNRVKLEEFNPIDQMNVKFVLDIINYVDELESLIEKEFQGKQVTVILFFLKINQ
jgi:molecular chaperone GrpE (heat shock protein)